MKGSDTETNTPSEEKKEEIIPHPHDVLCGRGGQSNNHPGNEWFRRLVRSNRTLYRSCPKHTKLLVAKAIVQAVQQQDPPGRFIKLNDSDTGSEWVSITYAQSVNKTSQALREKEPTGKKAKKVQQQKQQFSQEEKESDETKNSGSAKDSPKRVQFEGDSAKPTKVQPHKRKHSSTEEEEDTQNSTVVGKKRKVADKGFVKPSWWGVKPIINRVITTSSDGSNTTKVLGPIVTPVNNETIHHSPKKVRIQSEIESVDTNNGYEITNMGRRELRQEPIEMDPGPLPIETSLVSRQSSMFRFLSNTGIFSRRPSGTMVQPPPLGRANSTVTDPAPLVDFQSDQWSQPKEEHMGKTSVEQLRARQIEHQQSQNDMEDMPTSGLIDDNDVAHPPKALKSQMSDWLTSFFPSTSKGSEVEATSGRATPIINNNRQQQSQEGNIGEVAMPPPPGGGRSVSSKILDLVDFKQQSQEDGVGEAAIPPPPGGGRSVSSAIFGLVESPSLLLTTLKSGVSSMFSQQQDVDMATPIRRFPSSFQQRRQSTLKGNLSATSTTTFGKQTKATDSLLDDVEETDDVRNLRNVGPIAAPAPTGPRFY